MDQAFAEIFSPLQMGVVLVLALLLFGPKKLPELGKQLGSALRDFNKAKNDMMRSFSLDHDPDEHKPYSDYDSHHYDYAGYQDPYKTANPDLTDYTMVGLPPKDVEAPKAITSAVPFESGPGASADYVIVSPKSVTLASDDSRTLTEHKADTHPGLQETIG